MILTETDKPLFSWRFLRWSRKLLHLYAMPSVSAYTWETGTLIRALDMDEFLPPRTGAVPQEELRLRSARVPRRQQRKMRFVLTSLYTPFNFLKWDSFPLYFYKASLWLNVMLTVVSFHIWCNLAFSYHLMILSSQHVICAHCLSFHMGNMYIVLSCDRSQ